MFEDFITLKPPIFMKLLLEPDDGGYDYEVMPSIERVIFNNPATIVYWDDGTKTVVKCGAGDIFDEEKGLALAYMKRSLGNTGGYNEVIKQWCKEDSWQNNVIEKMNEYINATTVQYAHNQDVCRCNKCGEACNG